MRILTLALLCPLLAVAGCNTDSFQRKEGVTTYAGNAIASNTVMQIVDPWQAGVEDTDLEVPAERPQAAEEAATPVDTAQRTTN